ncbi:TIGR00270 family protein [Candidatus Bathyarchaeota archaeon]|nr:MAG: TIGR00270 family protein [Candidatus Bathyarchaeota archaeon]TEU06568.1 MAG: TIGR00270 family protein [Candidatus Bathyarchaeota archaeon]
MIKQFGVTAIVRCEVCGRRIRGKPFKAMIEGAKMIVCGGCAKLGSVHWEAQPVRRIKRPAKILKPVKLSIKKPSTPSLIETLEVVEDFGARIRKARRELELSHEDLGRKIGEKVSVLRKIESGKMTPDHALAEKLGHTLKIKLLVPPSEPKAPSTVSSSPREITLGELIHLKKKEATKERKSL